MSLPYYKRYPRDFLEGCAGMSLELKGAYGIVIDLIYIQNGKLPDDANYIAGHLGCSVRKWNSLRSQLIERGKINADLGIISTLRSDKEQIILSKYRDKQAENSKKPRKHGGEIKTVANSREAEPEPDLKDYSALRATEVFDLMIEAAGNSVDHHSPNIAFIKEPLRWLSGENAVDLELDMLPAIRRIAMRKSGDPPLKSWSYFRAAIFEERDRRLTPNPEPKERDDKHNRTTKRTIAEIGQRRRNASLDALAEYEADRMAEEARSAV